MSPNPLTALIAQTLGFLHWQPLKGFESPRWGCQKSCRALWVLRSTSVRKSSLGPQHSQWSTAVRSPLRPCFNSPLTQAHQLDRVGDFRTPPHQTSGNSPAGPKSQTIPNPIHDRNCSLGFWFLISGYRMYSPFDSWWRLNFGFWTPMFWIERTGGVWCTTLAFANVCKRSGLKIFTHKSWILDSRFKISSRICGNLESKSWLLHSILSESWISILNLGLKIWIQDCPKSFL